MSHVERNRITKGGGVINREKTDRKLQPNHYYHNILTSGDAKDVQNEW